MREHDNGQIGQPRLEICVLLVEACNDTVLVGREAFDSNGSSRDVISSAAATMGAA